MKTFDKVFCSIIVPVYNTEKYLNKCINSILDQTYKNFELIIIDDGSTDRSPAICDVYAQNDERIKLVHQANCGHTKAREAGLLLATGEYVFFVDSDDWIEPDALDTINKSVVKTDADIVTFDSYFCHDDKKVKYHQLAPSGVYDKKGLLKFIYPKMIYSGRFFYFGVYASMWNKVFRRSILAPNLLNVDKKIRIGEDGVTTFATFLDAQKVCVLGKTYLYDYRDDNISITRSYYAEQFNNARLLTKTLRDISKAKNVYDLNDQIDYYFMYNIFSIFVEEFYYKHHKNLFKRIKDLRDMANEEEVRQIVSRINISNMGRGHRFFFELLRNNSILGLVILAIIIAMKKRLKNFLSRISSKN